MAEVWYRTSSPLSLTYMSSPGMGHRVTAEAREGLGRWEAEDSSVRRMQCLEMEIWVGLGSRDPSCS